VRRGSTARLFVAVDPPAEVREALAEWARAATKGGDRPARTSPLRVLDPELLHVTLCFLGNRPVAEMDSLGAQLAACGGPTDELALGAPLWLPARRPRALAVELHDDRDKLARLQLEVMSALGQVSGSQSGNASSAGDGDTRGPRRFHPHITVARLSRGAAPHKRALPPTPSLSFVPRELVLYRSWLSPEGASYEAIAAHPLG
jgi:2'-5' RNA ligase